MTTAEQPNPVSTEALCQHLAVIGKTGLVLATPDRPGAVRMPRGISLDRERSKFSSIAALHATLSVAVRKRGYHWGLFRGSCRCPAKTGYLRYYWMEGFRDGREDRRQARRSQAAGT